jgi:hypothetical protein
MIVMAFVNEIAAKAITIMVRRRSVRDLLPFLARPHLAAGCYGLASPARRHVRPE